MITIRLLGGLGNQLFQVAAGAWLQDRRGLSVRWDASWFDDPASGDSARHLEVASLLRPGELLRLPTKVAKLVYSTKNPWLVRESGPGHEVLPAISRGRAWVEGYFQRYSYPAEVLTHLTARLAPVLAVHAPAKPMDAIGVHIRLGDYVANPTTRAHHGVTPSAYFAKAVRTLQDELGLERVVVFTDSPAMVVDSYLDRLGPTAQLAPAGSAWVDMATMASCRGLVISNSSLSWWAGFMGERVLNRTASVIAPTPWLGAPGPADRLMPGPRWSVHPRGLS